MTAQLMDGKVLRDEIIVAIRQELDALGSPPICLATVLVGDDRPSEVYVRMKQQAAERAGLRSKHVALAVGTSQGQIEAAVAELAAHPAVHGILVQLPLPDGLDADAVLALVPP